MGRRNDHTRKELKEMAIKAGTKLIEDKGLQNCSARKIAKKIGYSVGTLYNVFENYDDLVFHINAVTLDDLQHYFEENRDRDLKGVEALKLMGACYIQFAHENNSRWSALFEYLRPRNVVNRYFFSQAHLFYILNRDRRDRRQVI